MAIFLSKMESIQRKVLAATCVWVFISHTAVSFAAQRNDEIQKSPSRVSQAEKRKLDLMRTGKQADNIADLTALIPGACKLQPWQFRLRPVGSNGIRIERSSTMSTVSSSCINVVIWNSKFVIVN
jgi:hypothetical protein